MVKQVLGKGLEALLPEGVGDIFEKKEEIRKIPIAKIVASRYQPRSVHDKKGLGELSRSISAKGLIQPLVVRPVEKGRYELVAGGRRLQAAAMAGFKAVPSIVRHFSDQESLEAALIENLQREDLNPVDEALAYQRLIKEFHLTQEQVAAHVGKDRSTIANVLRILTLPERVRGFIIRGTVKLGHARALLALSSQEEQLKLCRKIEQGKVTVRDIERRGRKGKSGERDKNVRMYEDVLRRRLATKVRIIRRGKKGKIEIEFYSDDEFERLMEFLGISLIS